MFSITEFNSLRDNEQFEYTLNNKDEIINNKNINTDSKSKINVFFFNLLIFCKIIIFY